MSELAYNPTELLICIASRLMEDETTAFIGTGIPMLAASLAQRRQAPSLIPIFEFGGVGAILEDLPMAVGEARTFHKALHASGITDIMETATRGFIDYGFLGGAQIDPYGNLNSTVIGPHHPPKVRLPGSGGANDVGSLCWCTIIIMRHSRRSFVPQPGTGPLYVVSTLALMDFDEETKRMRLKATHPGVTVEQVVAETGFELIIPGEVGANEPPSAEEVRLLREEVDRQKLYI
jgi:glutaconate CoA-transferase subunit B